MLVNGKEYDFHEFYPIKYGRGTIEKMLDLSRMDDLYPEYLIPFASDSGGNEYLFSVREEDKEYIFFVDHEFYEDKNDINFICRSMQEFFNMLNL